jgi:hypothetical protein
MSKNDTSFVRWVRIATLASAAVPQHALITTTDIRVGTRRGESRRGATLDLSLVTGGGWSAEARGDMRWT